MRRSFSTRTYGPRPVSPMAVSPPKVVAFDLSEAPSPPAFVDVPSDSSSSSEDEGESSSFSGPPQSQLSRTDVQP